MTIYLGSTQVSNIYKGSASITAYVGDLVASGGGAEAVFQTFFDQSIVDFAKADDTSGYTLGAVFTFNKAGYIDAGSIFKPTGSVQSLRRIGIWNTSGDLLAQGSRGELQAEPAANQYIPVSLSTPLAVTEGQTVVVGLTVNTGGYSAEAGAFTDEVVSGDIIAPASATVSGNGRFNDSSGTTLNYPNTSGNGANYRVDVRFYADQEAPSGILAGYPNAANSGHSGTLTPYAGSNTISTNGTILEDLDITGALTITGDNVIIRNCRITYNDVYGIDGGNASDLTVQDCTIIGPGDAGEPNAGILGQGTFTGNEVSLSENGIVISGGSATVSDNYIHDLLSGKAEPHYDGITAQGGQDGVLISHNTVVGADTSDIFLKDDFGPINDVTIDDNLLLGDPGYMVVVDEVTPGNITNISVTNNKMIRGGFGYYSSDIEGVTISGNVNAYSNLPI